MNPSKAIPQPPWAGLSSLLTPSSTWLLSVLQGSLLTDRLPTRTPSCGAAPQPVRPGLARGRDLTPTPPQDSAFVSDELWEVADSSLCQPASCPQIPALPGLTCPSLWYFPQTRSLSHPHVFTDTELPRPQTPAGLCTPDQRPGAPTRPYSSSFLQGHLSAQRQ